MAKAKVPSTLITGNTFPVKEELKALGAWWDKAKRGWWVPNTNFQAAQLLMATSGMADDDAREQVSNPAARSASTSARW